MQRLINKQLTKKLSSDGNQSAKTNNPGNSLTIENSETLFVYALDKTENVIALAEIWNFNQV